MIYQMYVVRYELYHNIFLKNTIYAMIKVTAWILYKCSWNNIQNILLWIETIFFHFCKTAC